MISFFKLLNQTVTRCLSFLILAITIGGMPCASAQSEWNQMSVKDLKQQAPELHPAALYTLAMKLFEDGNKDEAVFWFYAGQLRYRFFLKASKNLEKTGDSALFGSLSETIGKPINEYAYGDIPKLLRTIDKVLEWDAATPNKTTSKTVHASELKQIRDGLISMSKKIEASKEQIRKQREANGLPNRN